MVLSHQPPDRERDNDAQRAESTTRTSQIIDTKKESGKILHYATGFFLNTWVSQLFSNTWVSQKGIGLRW